MYGMDDCVVEATAVVVGSFGVTVPLLSTMLVVPAAIAAAVAKASASLAAVLFSTGGSF